MDELVIPGHGVTPESLASVPRMVQQRLITERKFLNHLESLTLTAKQAAQVRLDEIADQLARCHSLLQQLRLPKLQADQLVRFVETFGSLDRVNLSATTAHVDTVRGMVVLPEVETERQPVELQRVIVDPRQSVGIPGNNMVISHVRFQGDTPEPTVQLDGDPDNHAHEVSMLDGRPDTWFEWERNLVKAVQPLSLHGTAYVRGGNEANQTDVWQVTEGLDWSVHVAYPGIDVESADQLPVYPIADVVPAPDGVPARLVMTLVFVQPIKGCWLSLDVLCIGRVPVLLNRLEASLDGNSWFTVAEQVVLSESASSRRFFLGLDSEVKYVRLDISAAGFYRPRQGLAHLYGVVFLKETHKKFVFGIQYSKKESRYTRRVSFGQRAVGSLVVEDKDASPLGVRLAGAFIGQAIAHAQVFSSLVNRVLSESALGNGLTWVLKQLSVSPNVVVQVVGKLILTYAGAKIVSLIHRESKKVEVERSAVYADVLDGWRSAFGIRELQLVRSKHQTNAVYESTPVFLPAPVRYVQLVADEMVPSGTSIEYSVRGGDGEWMPILPYRRAGARGSVDFGEPVQKVQIRAVLKTENEMVTPAIYGLALEGA